MSSVNDILIMLYLYSSNWLTLNRKLISAEKDLDYAIRIIKMPYKINQSKRPDIPIIPKTILKQRLILQKALILKEYSKVKQSAVLLTSLLKVGKIYDPTVRKEGLKLLIKIFKGYAKTNLFKEYKETKNLTAMLELFNENKSKNVVLWADSNNDKEFEFKKDILLSIFDELRPQDKVAFVSVARRVNIIYSLTSK